MRKTIYLFYFIIVMSLLNCGGGDKEAKELLQRILKLVGIPQNIIVNICQDTNTNGICEAKELQSKININKHYSLENFLEKVTLNEENQYFLENYDSTKPILLELQNQESFRYDDGKFTLHYAPTTQKLSILQTMVDSGYLEQKDILAIQEANHVSDFYFVLLRDTYSNMNRLRAKGLDNTEATARSLKEMAQELLLSGIDNKVPEALNSCGDNQACIDSILENVSNGLLIETEESRDIAELPKGNPFITLWKTNNEGVSSSSQITIPTKGDGYDYTVVWGDGTNSRNLKGNTTHTYSTEGNYTIEIYGDFPQIYFKEKVDESITDSKKLLSILAWGDNPWRSMNSAFFGCKNMLGDFKDTPNLSNVTDMSSMFYNALKFDKDIGTWNIQKVQNMSEMFSNVTLSTKNYTNILLSWSKKEHQQSVEFNAGDSYYSYESLDARENLVSNDYWMITDNGCDSSCNDVSENANNELYKYQID